MQRDPQKINLLKMIENSVEDNNAMLARQIEEIPHLSQKDAFNNFVDFIETLKAWDASVYAYVDWGRFYAEKRRLGLCQQKK